jgi:hypothetical protein
MTRPTSNKEIFGRFIVVSRAKEAEGARARRSQRQVPRGLRRAVQPIAHKDMGAISFAPPRLGKQLLSIDSVTFSQRGAAVATGRTV